jgi:hypothetical protein
VTSGYTFTWYGPDEPQPSEPVSAELLADVERVLAAHGIRPLVGGPDGEALRRALIIEHVRRMARAYAGRDPEPYPPGMLPGSWVQVSGGGLPVPVQVRIHRHADGRYVITGLIVGDATTPKEIASRTLRRISLIKIVADLFKDFDPAQPSAFPFPEFPEAVCVAADIDASAHGRRGSAGRERGPDSEKLQAFAATYRTELARQPHRAMTAAAAAHHISRATAHRWAIMCRHLGYLPAAPEPGAE